MQVCSGTRRTRAHPRSRGEHLPVRLPGFPSPGSSPLARGTRGVCEGLEERGGLIPARAGNTPKVRCRGCCVGAHPRSRGEHASGEVLIDRALGSSPLARGTPRFVVMVTVTVGLIPARAGNTPPPRYAPRLVRAHPRSRGEHSTEPNVYRGSSGSSPLARGTPAGDRKDPPTHGLIPARAGNTTHREGPPAR